jgi:hypothetical protein
MRVAASRAMARMASAALRLSVGVMSGPASWVCLAEPDSDRLQPL